jgi:hypothetical protein
VPIGVSSFIGTVSVNWGGSSAAAVLAMLPMFIIGLLMQRFPVRGLAMGRSRADWFAARATMSAEMLPRRPMELAAATAITAHSRTRVGDDV